MKPSSRPDSPHSSETFRAAPDPRTQGGRVPSGALSCPPPRREPRLNCRTPMRPHNWIAVLLLTAFLLQLPARILPDLLPTAYAAESGYSMNLGEGDGAPGEGASSSRTASGLDSQALKEWLQEVIREAGNIQELIQLLEEEEGQKETETDSAGGSGTAGGSPASSAAPGTSPGTVSGTPPEKEIASDHQQDSAYKEAAEEVLKNCFQELVSKGEDAAEVYGDIARDKSLETAAEAARRLQDTYKLPQDKWVQEISDAMNEQGTARALQENADRWYKASTGLKWLGMGMDALNICNDVQDLQHLENQRTSMRVLEGTAIAADLGLAAYSIFAAAASLSPPGLALSIGVGVAAAFLHSSDFADWANSLDSGFLDAVDEFFGFLLPWMKTPEGVNCYKPNIYVYRARKGKIRLWFDFPSLLTRTIPDYSGAWTVDFQGTPSESLLEDAQGNDYGYLFYESVSSRSLFQRDEGWRIPADQREQRFRTILTAMGFNAQETEDFIAFWTEKLEPGTDYVMYPQTTETVDLAMPLQIHPAPETIHRIWFYFEEEKGQAVEEPHPEVLDRDGEYTVIEWGGLLE